MQENVLSWFRICIFYILVLFLTYVKLSYVSYEVLMVFSASQITASMNLAEGLKMPKLSAESTWNFEV